MTISGTYKNEGLGKIIHTNVIPDDCLCPENDLNNFLKTWKCKPIPKLLQKQLKEFGTINWDEKRQEACSITIFTSTKIFSYVKYSDIFICITLKVIVSLFIYVGETIFF